MAVRIHLFSFRTQKLSSLAPKILCWRRHGKIGSCRIQYCLLAQQVEPAAVNRVVVSSSLTEAAKKKRTLNRCSFLFAFSLCQRRELIVRPSHDGQTLMGEDSVVKRRSDWQSQPLIWGNKYFAYRPFSIFYYLKYFQVNYLFYNDAITRILC